VLGQCHSSVQEAIPSYLVLLCKFNIHISYLHSADVPHSLVSLTLSPPTQKKAFLAFTDCGTGTAPAVLPGIIRIGSWIGLRAPQLPTCRYPVDHSTCRELYGCCTAGTCTGSLPLGCTAIHHPTLHTAACTLHYYRAYFCWEASGRDYGCTHSGTFYHHLFYLRAVHRHRHHTCAPAVDSALAAPVSAGTCDDSPPRVPACRCAKLYPARLLPPAPPFYLATGCDIALQKTH